MTRGRQETAQIYANFSFVLGPDSHVLNATLLPAPTLRVFLLAWRRRQAPGRGAHVQLLLFLRPSVLVMECSPNISLASAETLPRAFAVVLTKYRISDIYRTGEATCGHKGRQAIAHLCEVTGSCSRKPRR